MLNLNKKTDFFYAKALIPIFGWVKMALLKRFALLKIWRKSFGLEK
jgi:hypothetical protein